MKCDCDYILPSNKDWEPHYQNCSTVWTKTQNSQPLKNEDGTFRLRNQHLAKLDNDILYHLGLDKTSINNHPAKLGDIKFVCMGGTEHRMKEFAEYISRNVVKVEVENLTKHAHRYAMYKIGPALAVNHGIGIPSMTVALQEVIKLLSYAKAKDPIIFRIGTSGGLNIDPGSLVISSWALNGLLEKSYNIPIMGIMHKFTSIFDTRLSQELYYLSQDSKDNVPTYIGGTMATDDFYRGQGRTDGPFCEYTEDDKLNFLRKLEKLGVKNIEMEATALAAMTREAGLRSADVCVTLVDRLSGDQVKSSKDQLLEWEKRPMLLIGKYISAYLNKQ